MANLSNINGKFVVEQTTGFVGIGTTDPAYLLHVNSSDITNGTRLIIENTNGSGKKYGLISDNTGVFTFRDVTASADRFSISNLGDATFAGNLGIGIAPLAPLQVKTATNLNLTVTANGSSDVRINAVNDAVDATVPLEFNATNYEFLGTGNSTFAGAVSATGVIFANRTLEALGQNLTHGASRIKICQENTTKSQIRYYGADASTKGSLEFMATTSDGSSSVTPLSIDSSGNVGIGVTPTDYYAKNLVVTGPAEGGITIASTGNHTNYLLFADSTSGVARYAGMIGYAHDTDLMEFRTNSIQRMTIDSSGNVGIGVTAFTNNLTNGRGIDIKNNAGLIGYANAMYISSNVYYNSGWKYKSTGTAALLQVGSTSGTVSLRQAASGNINQAVSFTQTLTINNSGNVGIGTDDPVKKLDVRGQLAISNSASSYWYIDRNDTTGNFEILTDTNSSVFNIDTSGNVGIGGGAINSPTSVGTFLNITGRNGVGGGTAGIVLKDYDNAGWDIWNSGGILNFRYNNGASGAGDGLSIDTTSNATFSGNVILASGKYLGVGNTAPAGTRSKLGVSFNVTGSAASLAESVTYATMELYPYRNGSTYGMFFGNKGVTDGYIQSANNAGNASGHIFLNPFGGNIGIGTVNNVPDSLLVIQADTHNEAFAGKRDATNYLWFLRNENNSGRFQLHNSNNVMTINMTGADGNINISGTLTEGSDIRIKENIKPLKNQLEIVNKLNPVSYNKIGFKENEIGFIAQEVEEILPELVKDDEKGMKSIAYSKMNTILVKAIQELKADNDILKSRIETLENK